jgi:hypothetical protein
VINRERQTATLISYSSGTDEYGKPLTSIGSSREIEIMITIYKQNNAEDIRFIDATHLGLTAETAITDKHSIIINDEEYKVLYVIPSKRLAQVFLKKVL